MSLQDVIRDVEAGSSNLPTPTTELPMPSARELVDSRPFRGCPLWGATASNA